MLDIEEYRHEGTFAASPRTTRGVPLVLNASPDGKTLLYSSGNCVIMRDVETPSHCRLYCEHTCPVNVAAYAPSGFYIASGDSSGKVRIWDTTQETHILKGEYGVISGSIKDLKWSPDSQRVAAVGDGKERFGHVFQFDTGTSTGSLSGQSKPVNSIDFKPQRPFRIVTASEDNTVAMFEGPPFKFKTILLFDGSEGGKISEFIDSKNAHNGGVYAVGWTPDGTKLFSASGDKTCKLWDVETKKLISTYSTGTALEDMQLGCICIGGHLISVALPGTLCYWDPRSEKPTKLVYGHNRPILASAKHGDTLYTADNEGNLARWNLPTGSGGRLQPQVHKAPVVSLAVDKHDLDKAQLITVAWDDTLAVVDAPEKDDKILPLNAAGARGVKLSRQPSSVCVAPGTGGSALRLMVAACDKELCLWPDGNPEASMAVCRAEYGPTSVDLNLDGVTFAVGGNDSKVHVYKANTVLDGPVSEPVSTIVELSHTGAVTDVKFSADGKFLAACDAARRVVVYDTHSWTPITQRAWGFHTAKVVCLSWAPDCKRLASGGLDSNVIVWDVGRPDEHPVIIKGAHQMSHVNAIEWLDNGTLLTCGHDGNLKKWRILP